jgi:hypothetical protein
MSLKNQNSKTLYKKQSGNNFVQPTSGFIENKSKRIIVKEGRSFLTLESTSVQEKQEIPQNLALSLILNERPFPS